MTDKIKCPALKTGITSLQCRVKQKKDKDFWGDLDPSEMSKLTNGCPCLAEGRYAEETKTEGAGMWKDENGERKNYIRIGICPVCSADKDKRIYKYKGEEMCGGCLTRKKRGAELKEKEYKEEKQEVKVNSESNGLKIPYHFTREKTETVDVDGLLSPGTLPVPGTGDQQGTATKNDTGWIDDHWAYVETMLRVHGEAAEVIAKIGFHYRSAMEHGAKHAREERV